jgi:hypothetical protein
VGGTLPAGRDLDGTRFDPYAERKEMSLRPQPYTVVEEDPAGLFVAGTTTGFSGREWWGGLFLFAFFAGWVASLVPVAGMFAKVPAWPVLVFMLAWSAIWIPTGAISGLILVWGTVGGRETVVLDSTALVLRQAVGPFGLTRAYAPSDISDFRVLTGETVFRSGYAVAFTVKGRTIRFGNWPARNEANAVARALSARLDELIAAAPSVTTGVIEFRARPEWVRDSFLLFWLVAWIAGWSLGLRSSDNVTVGLAVGSIFIAALIAAYVIRDILERQRVSVGPMGVEIARSVGPLRRTRRYDRAAIRSICAVPVQTEDGPEEDKFELVLDLGRRGVRFGIGLTRTEAQAAARELNERLSS